MNNQVPNKQKKNTFIFNIYDMSIMGTAALKRNERVGRVVWGRSIRMQANDGQFRLYVYKRDASPLHLLSSRQQITLMRTNEAKSGMYVHRNEWLASEPRPFFLRIYTQLNEQSNAQHRIAANHADGSRLFQHRICE